MFNYLPAEKTKNPEIAPGAFARCLLRVVAWLLGFLFRVHAHSFLKKSVFEIAQHFLKCGDFV
jgi:hypothetical protein